MLTIHKLKLTLLSDSLPGFSQEYGGLVDIDVCLDKFGIPYIPSKRIKGLMKEFAKNLKEIALLGNVIDDIFEKETFKLSNGYLKNYKTYIEFLEYISKLKKERIMSQIFNQNRIIKYFTNIRAQTSVEYESGAAKKHSLRLLRVLRKGLTFYFEIKFDENQFQEDINNICKVIREFGTRRNRGLGRIKLELIPDNQELKSSKIISTEKKEKISKILESSNDEESFKLSLKLTNNEQILVTNQAGSANTTDNSIPGSTILGTFAVKFIQTNNVIQPAHEYDRFFDLFLNEEVIFSNFYPLYENNFQKKVFYPAPLSIMKKKNYEKYFDYSKVPVSEDDEPIKIKGLISLENSNGLTISFPALHRHVEYHHSRPPDRSIGHATEDLGDFYQYEVLNPRHQFYGFIISSSKNLKEILKLFDSDTITINIGKSKTVQYGKCTLELDEIPSISKKQFEILDNKNILITLQSDLILQNEYGFIIPDSSIFLKEFCEILKIKYENIEIKKQFLQFKIIGGFSNIWKLPKIQYYALAAGSELLIEIVNEGEINTSNINGKSFGLKTFEGYGQVKINWHGSTKVLKTELEPKRSYVPEDLKKISELIKFCLKERLMYLLKKNAHLMSNELDLSNLTASFLQRIKLFILNSETFEDLSKILSNLFDQLKRKLSKISISIKFDDKKKDFKPFDSFLKNLNDISTNRILRDSIMPLVSELIPTDFYNSEKFYFYQEYCKIFLNDLQYKLKKLSN